LIDLDDVFFKAVISRLYLCLTVKLLQKPSLKKSDLLFTFLISHKEAGVTNPPYYQELLKFIVLLLPVLV
jgi:hypothetical protein